MVIRYVTVLDSCSTNPPLSMRSEASEKATVLPAPQPCSRIGWPIAHSVLALWVVLLVGVSWVAQHIAPCSSP